MKTTSFHCFVIFRKRHSESYFITAMLKVCSEQLCATLTPAF